MSIRRIQEYDLLSHRVKMIALLLALPLLIFGIWRAIVPCQRFTRLTNAFSKKLENHAASVALYMVTYTFHRKHMTLGTTPAVKAGIADHIWTVEEIVGLLEKQERKAA